jgi:hypothetical protein
VGNSKFSTKVNKMLNLLLPKHRDMLYNKTENKKRKNVNNVGKKDKK